MSGTEYEVAGTFCPYDFEPIGDKNAFDWAYTASNGKSYQLRGTAPTEDNVFGFKEVNITAPEPLWYMFQLHGDVDGDGSTKFDWVLTSVNPDAAASYKLSGVSDNGTFEYSQKLNVDIEVNGNKVAQKNQNGMAITTPQGDMNCTQDANCTQDMNTTQLQDMNVTQQQDMNKTQTPLDVTQMPLYELSDLHKENLLFMYNEEKMARDLYLGLNAVNPSKPLENIALNAEQTHMDLVYDLLVKYELDSEDLRSLAPNEFSLSSVKTLFDTLYAEGEPSLQASLSVGCKVEVTDINDLLVQMDQFEGIEDVLQVYDNLLSGSYSHYWAFDNALKGLGVVDGCCSVGDDFCKTAEEYPQVSHGKGPNK
jgi:hypothetical protein